MKNYDYEVLHGEIFNCSNEIEKYQCKSCPSFRSNLLTSLRNHLRDGHKIKSSEENVYKCLKCFFVTHSTFLMEHHNLSSECATINEDKTNKQLVYYVYMNDQSECKFRPKDEPQTSLYRVPEVAYRLKSKSGINWLHCEQCPYKCKNKTNLKRHMYRHINPENIQWFECEQCSSRFKQKNYFKKHIKSAHTRCEDIQWFECEQCPSKFKRKVDLKPHVKLCHGRPEDIQWFECEQCSSKFKRKGDLKRHIILRHSKPEDVQWFACDQCPSRFKQKGYLKRHAELHHGTAKNVQWFKCDQCGCKFKLKGSLNKHLALCHGGYTVVQMRPVFDDVQTKKTSDKTVFVRSLKRVSSSNVRIVRLNPT